MQLPYAYLKAGTVKRRDNEELKQEVKQEAWQEALQAQAAAQQENAKVTQGASGQEGHSGESDGASGNATSESGRKRKSVEQTEEERKRKQQQRMVKNRESAARSRERKQRYTAALEDKVEQLTTANQQLREELDKKEHDNVTHAEVEHSREQDGPLTRRQLRRYHSGPPNIDL
jgi:ABA responsive element binding factor